jgi:hypothetical protein
MSHPMTALAKNGQPEGRLFYGKPLVFREKAHRYYWGGELVPSVTTILNNLGKPGLIQWAADEAVAAKARGATDEEARNAHTAKKEQGADIGTQVHSYAQDCLRAGHCLPMPDDPLVKPACEGFAEWFSAHDIHAVEVERPVMYVSEEIPASPRFAGRCDFFGRIDGQLGVMDIKTANTVIDRKTGDLYREMQLQTAAYEVALITELRLNDGLARWILHLDKKTGAHKLYPKPSCPMTAAAWLALARFDQMMRAVKVG